MDIAGNDAASRLRLDAGGVMLFRVEAGDILHLTDIEGAQSAELYAFADMETVFGPVPAGMPGRLPDRLRAAGSAGEIVAGELAGSDLSGSDLVGAKPFIVSATDAPAGVTTTLAATGPAVCVLAVPPAESSTEAVVPTTAFDVRIDRAAPPTGRVEPPVALAPPLLDIRIAQGTARAYRVAAGEYIQVVDIEGRQCSDFVAFDAAALGAGTELGLDATATRTLTGRTYPLPGLASKFFDATLRPLLEVVRDTCGRHDTFALACTAKYYDDKGYPGHSNCSDNFNAALAPYGVAPKRGWPAINFFYNTSLDAGGGIGLDEPWSRPGDYVLMRALTDLVCASSSCPDDVDPANGWNPTDIQVRIYPKEHSFSRGIVYRMTPDSPPILTRETGFHPRTSALTRRMTEYRNYWLPDVFQDEDVLAEYWACRERVAITDLSPLRKFEVLGPDAEALLDHAVTRDIRKLAVGQVVYTAICHPHGGMMDDGTVFRIDRDNFRLVCGDDYCGPWLRKLAAEKGYKAWVRSSSDNLHNVAVQGPLSRQLLSQVVWTAPTRTAIDALRWFRFTVGRLHGPEGTAIVVSRTGYTGELGYEIWCHPNDAPTVWDAIWAAGEPLGLTPLGLQAVDMLRIEAGLAFAGHEFCDETDPFEAGIGFTVPLDTKQGDFVGREALLRRRDHPAKRLVGLRLDGEETAVHGDPVHVGRARIGVVTSATRSPLLGTSIALARVDVAYAALGTRLEIGKLDGHQKRLGAEVVRFPHFDPEKTRVRA
ncbi:MAG TPA: DUF1989 domain-containing protein [Bradyrhizobium sp.]|nr:DUF1989 domain-containing protein [Bradyrhizobium sp.]